MKITLTFEDRHDGFVTLQQKRETTPVKGNACFVVDRMLEASVALGILCCPPAIDVEASTPKTINALNAPTGNNNQGGK